MHARRRSIEVAVSLAIALLAAAAPAASAPAVPPPTIEFLNPSSFALAADRGYVVSDQATDVGPDCCAASDEAFRFSAWVTGAPAESSVFFTVVQGALDFELPAVRPSDSAPSSDTWEASWDIPPDVLNGPATATAYVVVDNEPIAQKSIEVTILRVSPGTDLAYPQSGGSFGTFAPLATALPEDGPAEPTNPAGTVDALYSGTADMSYVRTFYTTSAPGTEPVWHVCGTEPVGSNSNGEADNGVRCMTADAADAGRITAVAAVANNSPGDYDDRFNQSGDAVRVVPYVQRPAALALDTPAQRVDKHAASERFFCSSTVTATVLDQLGRVVPGANVDAEAVGPTDALRFHTSSVLGGNVPPDRGAHSVETAFDCTGRAEVPPPNARPGKQGEHQIFGLPDVKHIESAAGTSDRGTAGFRLYSSAPGLTSLNVWVDETDDGCSANDDRFTTGEPSAAGSIGWGEDPPAPTPATPAALTSCHPDTRSARSVGIGVSDGAVAAGSEVRLSGRVRAADGGCRSRQQVSLQARRPGRRFRSVARVVTTATGRYVFEITARQTRDYRAVVPATSACLGARSRSVRVATS
ncbi:MAG TPA: hypothetical protein VEV43_08445 [Actinomycetota bacterium]|nr:hypothetical protein [Actinomycetota bacterium]